MFGVVIRDQLQNPIFGINNIVLPDDCFKRPVAEGCIKCTVPRIPLMPGTYSCDLYLGYNGQNHDVVMNAITFAVEETDVFGSGKLPPADTGRICWDVEWDLNEVCTAASLDSIAREGSHA
jgi:lipopolysaccharide transport system ATP-binding protein